MPLLLRRYRCCKCAGCAGIIGAPGTSSSGTSKDATACCELGNHLIAVSTCDANSSCCRFNQVANGKTTLTVQTALFGTLVFDDASIIVCSAGTTGCSTGVSLACTLDIRAAKIVSGNVIEVSLRFTCTVHMEPPLTADCGPWSSAWTETACTFLPDTNPAVWYALESSVSYIREYSGSTVVKSSTSNCGTSYTYCEHSGGTLVNALNGINGRWYAENASASIIPTGSAGTIFNNSCMSNAYLLSWSISPVPTVTELNTIASEGEC